jgi:hypothetical protein
VYEVISRTIHEAVLKFGVHLKKLAEYLMLPAFPDAYVNVASQIKSNNVLVRESIFRLPWKLPHAEQTIVKERTDRA